MKEKVFNFIICDNQELYLKIINDTIVEFFETSKYQINIYQFEDYNAEFINFIEKDIDNKVYFLDIKTRHSSGIDIARDIRKIDNKSPIIFITSYENYAIQILKSIYNINGFISKKDKNLKENIIIQLRNLINFADQNLYASFTDNNTKYHLLMSSILYIEIDNRITLIHIDGEEPIPVSKSLDKMQEYLDNRFERIHKSCIANMSRAKIISKRKKYVLFDNGQTTDLLSRDYKIKEKRKKSIFNKKKMV